VHVLAFALVSQYAGRSAVVPPAVPRVTTLVLVPIAPLPPVVSSPLAVAQPRLAPPPVEPASTTAAKPISEPPAQPAAEPVAEPASDRPRASLAAPPPPSQEEWALASTYTLKNSKRYRYTWSQQVRSQMGTAVQGPDEGVARFRVEISPQGQLTRLETLWSTSALAESLARKAIQAMPPLPPTPTGQPLIFEKTISFQSFAADGPPVYKDDCLPDPPAFRNAFAWNGRDTPSQVTPAVAAVPEKPDPKALEECLKQLPRDTIEAEMAQDKRVFDQWGQGAPGSKTTPTPP
jgi:TonB family protein